jgi:hypothetical protein
MSPARRRLDASSLIWGLLFLLIAGLGLWVAVGGPIDWHLITISAPVVLIALGLLGLLLSRPRR